jgi:DNA modification methylase
MSQNKQNGYAKLKAEYEVVYAGKDPKSRILTNTLEAPLQAVRVFNEDNPWDDGWRNMLIFGDNLLALKTLYEDMKVGGPNQYGLRNKITLIYIDPPFASRQDFMRDREKAYRDKVIGSQFIEFLRKRLIFLREILADDGSIYVHLDWKKGHYIKAIMDEVFGEHNFVNEVIWAYRERELGKDSWNRKHDTIYMYGKSEARIFNWKDVAEDYSEYTLRNKFKWIDEDGKRYRLRYKDGRNDPSEEGADTYRQYLDKSGVAPRDWWILPILNQAAKERLDYPNQKSEKLIERIVRASSNKGDVVLDCFAGSGTTLAVAEKLGRKWIGMDCGKLSVYTIQGRMLSLTDIVGSEQKDERNQLERIEFQNEVCQTRGMFLVSEKARRGQLEITNDFLHTLHNFLKELDAIDEFAIVCPEKKFHLSGYKEDETGLRFIKKGRITYKFSFIDPRMTQPRANPLKSRSFTLYNAGVYDKTGILDLHWEEYRTFVMKLFEVRDSPHEINGFRVDGYIGVHSAYVWEYPKKKTQAIDEEYVADLHKYLRGKAGERFYIIAPVHGINFMQDEIRLGNTIYTFLKVPVSVLVRLIQSGELGSYKQPKSEDDVNEVIDAFGFDFISQPKLRYTLHKVRRQQELFTEKYFVIRLKEFRSDGLLYSPEDFKNFETLSLVMVDFDYDKEPFTLDEHFWGKELVKDETKPVEIILDSGKWTKDKLAVVFIDQYGNEKKLIFNKREFK